MEKRRTRLVQVTSSVSSLLGGPSFVVEQTSSLLSREFIHSITVFGNSSLKISGTKIFQQPTLFSNRYGFFLGFPSRNLREEISNAEILIIHGFYLFSTLVALLFSSTSKIFVMPHGSLENYQEQKGTVRKKIFRKLFKLALNGRTCTFIVATESEVSGVKDVFPVDEVETVGIGVDEFRTKQNTASFLDSKINLLSLSRIHVKKRIDIAIWTVRILKDMNIQCVLRIAGDGDSNLISNLHQLVEELKLENEVIFLGHLEQDRKEEVIAKSDILLLPSENENFAIAVAELIVRGKPVIVSTNVAMGSFVSKYETGIVIEALDPTILAEAVLKVRENFSYYVANCLESADFLFWPNVFERWLQVLRKN